MVGVRISVRVMVGVSYCSLFSFVSYQIFAVSREPTVGSLGHSLASRLSAR